ncbi:TPA_asm: putative fiber [Coelastrella green algae MELD virus]|nr:TPA_asm: putative fiber [Coelastrella green algae MELD virus]
MSPKQTQSNKQNVHVEVNLTQPVRRMRRRRQNPPSKSAEAHVQQPNVINNITTPPGSVAPRPAYPGGPDVYYPQTVQVPGESSAEVPNYFQSAYTNLQATLDSHHQAVQDQVQGLKDFLSAQGQNQQQVDELSESLAKLSIDQLNRAAGTQMDAPRLSDTGPIAVTSLPSKPPPRLSTSTSQVDVNIAPVEKSDAATSPDYSAELLRQCRGYIAKGLARIRRLQQLIQESSSPHQLQVLLAEARKKVNSAIDTAKAHGFSLHDLLDDQPGLPRPQATAKGKGRRNSTKRDHPLYIAKVSPGLPTKIEKRAHQKRRKGFSHADRVIASQETISNRLRRRD